MNKNNIRIFKNWVTNGLSYIQLIPILYKVKKGDIVIDCGANIGVISEYFSKRGAQVYSFEPDPNAFKRLEKRFQNNPNVECINKGVWTENTKMNLYFHEDSNGDNISWSVGSSIIKEKKNVNASTSIEIDLIDLSEFIGQIGAPIKVLKIDIEGAEIAVINKLIDDNRQQQVGNILVETHETKIVSQVEELIQLRKRIKDLGILNINLNWL